MPFEMKAWLDENVVPLTAELGLRIYSFIWNGNPPKEILVWLLAGDDPEAKCTRCGIPRKVPAKGIECGPTGCDYPFDPQAWPLAVKALLETHEFRFDYLREQRMVRLESGLMPIFGGDGAPLYNQAGMASVRLFKKVGDVGLILQLGCAYPVAHSLSAGEHAAAATKAFFALFPDENALQVCQRFATTFGQA